jgi:fucose 4-O-acetylase-like acetyltransferase
MKTRNTKLDAIKMALIIFVVLGHVPLLSGFLSI